MSDIKINNMSFGYEESLILKDVNIDINKADFVGIIGANGTGKSTLIQLILGLLSPKEGSVTCNYNNVGYVSQVGFAVKADFPATVKEVIMLNLFREIGLFKRSTKKHEKMVEDVLATVGMLDLADRQIGKLSGGQQQRVMIAKALVSSPDILVLDEPTASVDAENEEMLYELLSRLNKERDLTIIMVTHNIENIEESMNKIYIIKNKLVIRRK